VYRQIKDVSEAPGQYWGEPNPITCMLKSKSLVYCCFWNLRLPRVCPPMPFRAKCDFVKSGHGRYMLICEFIRPTRPKASSVLDAPLRAPVVSALFPAAGGPQNRVDLVVTGIDHSRGTLE
jgi:hypothetical protein